MTYKSHIRNRTVILDEPIDLPDGAEVTVELHAPPANPWIQLQTAADSLFADSEKLLAQDIVPPTAAALRTLNPLLLSLQKKQVDPPFRIVPHGDGGIVLEWINAPRREIVKFIEIDADGQIEQTNFADNKFHSRPQVSQHPLLN